MKAELLVRRRVVFDEAALFADLLLWRVPKKVPGSSHDYKYSLALVANGICVLRYDNEAGKGDHKHIGQSEVVYTFVDVETLLEDFRNDVERWMREHRKL